MGGKDRRGRGNKSKGRQTNDANGSPSVSVATSRKGKKGKGADGGRAVAAPEGGPRKKGRGAGTGAIPQEPLHAPGYCVPSVQHLRSNRGKH